MADRLTPEERVAFQAYTATLEGPLWSVDYCDQEGRGYRVCRGCTERDAREIARVLNANEARAVDALPERDQNPTITLSVREAVASAVDSMRRLASARGQREEQRWVDAIVAALMMAFEAHEAKEIRAAQGGTPPVAGKEPKP